MRRLSFLLSFCLAVVLLASCTNPLSGPAPTSTPIPFALLNLDDLLIQENDMPAGMTGAQISHTEPSSQRSGADYYISQELAYDGKSRGQITIWIFEDPMLVTARYETEYGALEAECAKAVHQCQAFDPHDVPGLGDAAAIIDVYNYIGNDDYRLVFQHCHAVATVRMFASSVDSTDSVITYAQRLDERLAPIVCR
jgi:hypothetical protein